MIDDVCRALVYIREHIQEHCPEADPNQIFLSGHSAGAHLISLLVLDRSHLARHELPLSAIRGVIPMSGIYSLSNPTHDSKNNVRNWVFRILYSSNLLYPQGKQMNEYSPIEFIREARDDEQPLPPFLVISARFDMGLEVDAKRFVDRLTRCHHRVEYFTSGGMTTHATVASKFAELDVHRHFFEFVREHAKY